MIAQGYAFQHRALAEAMTAFSEMGSEWILEVTEFPVQATSDTRVDFILRNKSAPVFLTVECKRTNPAFSQWLFAKALYRSRKRRPGRDRIYIDGVFKYAARHSATVSIPAKMEPVVHTIAAPQSTYQICVASRTQKNGDLTGGGRDAFEKTVRQASRGTSGLINYFIDDPRTVEAGQAHLVIPVVFTTADLIVTEINLAEKADLHGEIDATDLEPSTTDWLYYEYHVEAGVHHKLQGQLHGESLSDALDRKFTRTIPVVNANSIGRFLSAFNLDLITD